MAAYEKLLTKDLELKISELHVTLPEGEIKGDLTLRLLKDMTFMQFFPIATQPQLLFDVLYIKSDLSLPASLVGEQAQNMLRPIYPGMQTGVFVEDGDNLTHKSETVDRKLMLNDKELRLQ